MYGQYKKFARVIKISQVLVFYFIESLQRHILRFFAKIHNCFFKLLSILAKIAPLQMFNWIENKLLAKGFKYLSHSCLQPTN